MSRTAAGSWLDDERVFPRLGQGGDGGGGGGGGGAAAGEKPPAPLQGRGVGKRDGVVAGKVLAALNEGTSGCGVVEVAKKDSLEATIKSFEVGAARQQAVRPPEASEDASGQQGRKGKGKAPTREDPKLWWCPLPISLQEAVTPTSVTSTRVVLAWSEVPSDRTKLRVLVPRLPRGLVALATHDFQRGRRTGPEEVYYDPSSWVERLKTVSFDALTEAYRRSADESSRRLTIHEALDTAIFFVLVRHQKGGGSSWILRDAEETERREFKNASTATRAFWDGANSESEASKGDVLLDPIAWMEFQLSKYLAPLLCSTEVDTFELWLGVKDDTGEAFGIPLPALGTKGVALKLPDDIFPPISVKSERFAADAFCVTAPEAPVRKFAVRITGTARAEFQGVYLKDWSTRPGRSFSPLAARCRVSASGEAELQTAMRSTSFVHVGLLSPEGKGGGRGQRGGEVGEDVWLSLDLASGKVKLDASNEKEIKRACEKRTAAPVVAVVALDRAGDAARLAEAATTGSGTSPSSLPCRPQPPHCSTPFIACRRARASASLGCASRGFRCRGQTQTIRG